MAKNKDLKAKCDYCGNPLARPLSEKLQFCSAWHALKIISPLPGFTTKRHADNLRPKTDLHEKLKYAEDLSFNDSMWKE